VCTATLIMALLVVSDDRVLKELDSLSGRWELLSIESGDQTVRGHGGFVFQRGELIWEPANKKEKITYRIRPSKHPKEIDITFVRSPGTVVDGRTLLGIYIIEGDVLRVCWSHNEGSRPFHFSGKGEPTLFVLKRVKSEP
jgi:uncharacterized protein (TIGR03067 family)